MTGIITAAPRPITYLNTASICCTLLSLLQVRAILYTIPRRRVHCQKQTPSRTAADIATECGYPSAQYFAHMFAAHFGTTPDAWRRR